MMSNNAINAMTYQQIAQERNDRDFENWSGRDLHSSFLTVRANGTDTFNDHFSFMWNLVKITSHLHAMVEEQTILTSAMNLLKALPVSSLIMTNNLHASETHYWTGNYYRLQQILKRLNDISFEIVRMKQCFIVEFHIFHVIFFPKASKSILRFPFLGWDGVVHIEVLDPADYIGKTFF